MAISQLVSLVMFSAVWALTGCGQDPAARATGAGGGVPVARVRILERQQQVTLQASVPPLIRVGREQGARSLQLPPGQGVALTLTPAGWRAGGTDLGAGPLVVSPVPQGTVTVNGKAYRGTYRMVPVSGREFDVVNDVDIESYLKGVVSRELLPKWELEAYRAQAIVARTYALFEMKTGARAGQHYDLHADTRSQVYGGMDAESEKSRRAVDDTAGVVVAYGPEGQEKIFKAYFSACCGGLGQSAADVFGEADIPPLRARNAGGTCSAATRYNWADVTLTKAELTRRVRAWGERRGNAAAGIGAVERVEVLSVNGVGRPSRFVLTDARGARYALGAEEMRWVVNTEAQPGTTVYSSFFTPVDQGDSVRLANGHGHGHGVGMCQWCVQSLALRGVRHEDIVAWSFPEAKLKRAY